MNFPRARWLFTFMLARENIQASGTLTPSVLEILLKILGVLNRIFRTLKLEHVMNFGGEIFSLYRAFLLLRLVEMVKKAQTQKKQLKTAEGQHCSSISSPSNVVCELFRFKSFE